MLGHNVAVNSCKGDCEFLNVVASVLALLAAPQPQSAELLPRNVMLGFVPTAGVSVTVCGFVGAKGSMGTTMSSLVICVRCSRTTHQDRKSRLRKTHCFSLLG